MSVSSSCRGKEQSGVIKRRAVKEKADERDSLRSHFLFHIAQVPANFLQHGVST